LPDGRHIMLLKVLMSNVCENDCAYCANRCSRDYERVEFTPDELSRLFVWLYQRGLVKGLFLSSAVSGSTDRCMSRMIAAVEQLRYRYGFRGYIHLKVLPGASRSSVERAVTLATRVSVNLEAPTQKHLVRIASQKEFDQLIGPMGWIRELKEEGRVAKAGQTTQFVVGAAGESDREIVTTTNWLYRKMDLARVYYSAFQPIVDTPLENHPPTPLMREHRLYQADFLLRKYGFSAEEICFDAGGQLPLKADPKMVWACSHPERFPVEVNRAPQEELLRVPGIGPVSARRIVRVRSQHTLSSLEDLKRLGAVTRWAAPFILFNGRRPPDSTTGGQLTLWDQVDEHTPFIAP
jgi:putative DNA modification/repair radical SAM protein